MRHRKKGRKLSRKTGPRNALLRALLRAILKTGDPENSTPERIRTTLPKAKELQPRLERLINLAKNDTLHHRRLAYRALQDWELVRKLFNDIGPRFADRNGGYTRITKLSETRLNDGTPLAIIELVEAPSLEAQEAPGTTESPPESPS